MNLKSLTCPNCGGSLDIEDGLDIFYCKYCGYKILLENQSEAAYNAKVRVKHMEHKERLQEKRNEHKERLQERYNEQERYKMEFKKKDDRWTFVAVFGIFGVIMAVCGIMVLSGNLGAQKQERELQSIVEEIMIDIENENFDEAYIKANSLYWDDSWTSEGEEKWDATREEIIKQIENAEKKSTGESSREKDDEKESGGFFGWFK